MNNGALLTLSSDDSQHFLTISEIDSYLSVGMFYALVVQSGALTSQPLGAGQSLLPLSDLTLYFQTPSFTLQPKSVNVPPSAHYLSLQGTYLESATLGGATTANTRRIEVLLYFYDSNSTTLACNSLTPSLGWASVKDESTLELNNLDISKCLSYDGSVSLYANLTIYREVGSGGWWTQEVKGLKLTDIGCPDANCLYCSGLTPDDGDSLCHLCSSYPSDLILTSSWECGSSCPSDHLLHQLF